MGHGCCGNHSKKESTKENENGLGCGCGHGHGHETPQITPEQLEILKTHLQQLGYKIEETETGEIRISE